MRKLDELIVLLVFCTKSEIDGCQFGDSCLRI